MERSYLALSAMTLLLLVSAGARPAQAAAEGKPLVYEGRSVAEWVERAITAEAETPAVRNAVIALCRLNEARVQAQVAAEVLKAGNSYRRCRAICVICALPRKSKVAEQALITALKDKDSNVRTWAALALGTFGDMAKEALPALTQALKDRSRACASMRLRRSVASIPNGRGRCS